MPIRGDRRVRSSQVVVQGRGQLAHGGVAVRGLLRHRSHDNLLQHSVQVGSQRGAVYHLIFCAVKIPLAILAACAIYNVWNTLGPGAAFAMMLIFGLLGAVYPAVLLPVLFTAGVREFYRTATVRRVY